MRNIILPLFLLFLPFLGHSQAFIEGFEGAIFPPAGWTVFDNGVGTDESWGAVTDPDMVHNGSHAAQVLRENISRDNTSEDWLVTPLTNIIPNAQLRFFSRSQLVGNQGTLYQIRISSANPTGGANDPSTTYTILKTYTETELSDIETVYKELKLSIPAAFTGTNRYIAFVRVYTQPTPQTGGDKWILDDVSMVTQCFDPTNLNATNVTAKTALLGWAVPNGGATSYDVEWGPTGFAHGQGLGLSNPTTNSITVTNLPVNSLCEFYVRSRCSSGTVEDWIGPFLFHTKDFGVACSEPKVVPGLPFLVTNDDTAIYGDTIDIAQGLASQCGASPPSTNYVGGNDVFYSYTAANDGLINILMTPRKGTTNSANSSIFVYESCSDIGVTCYAGMANAQATPREFVINVAAGHTYTILISSSSATQTINYDLSIEAIHCQPKPTQLDATNLTVNSADLSWTSPGYSAGEVAVQPLGSAMPLGAGKPVSDNPHTYTGLTSGTLYQYWVRGECAPGSGTYTAWSGPFPFHTLICNPIPAEQCSYTIRMTDSGNNGWNGAEMQVRQKGIVVATFGSTFTTGAGPVDVSVPLCKDEPFDIYWLTGGTKSQECAVSVLNSFGQTIFTKAAGVGTPDSIITPVGLAAVDCTAPRCDIVPINLTAVPSNFTAQLKWDAPATAIWDVYLVPKGDPAPNPGTTPTHPGVTINPFDMGGLAADTCYDFYVRVHCASANPSDWSTGRTFCTNPSCPKPTELGVSAITDTSAELTWTPAPTDNLWDILLVPSPTYTLPSQLPPANPSFPGQIALNNVNINGAPYTYPVSGLTPATIYFYYIRTKCSGNDDGVWAGPFAFNTVTCVSGSCIYKFTLTDAGGNGWQNARMQVRQNGIVVKQTNGQPLLLGPQISTGGGPITVNVPICPDVPFDLYWNVAGLAPNEIGVSIQNPSEDVIYTKAPGEGSPLSVLFSSKGNCTPPACPKPTSLAVVSTSQTSAILDWTQSGSAAQWEVYAVPTAGLVPPVNGSAVVGQDPWAGGPYYLAKAKPFTITGLLPGVSYTYYVRAICSDTEVSVWTISTPKAFTTKPLNDECANAILVPVNPSRVCNQMASGNTLGATGSQPFTFPACSGTTDDDIWFSFVATAPLHVITISNIVGKTKLINHALYEGTDCTSLKQLYCSTTNVSGATNLTIGQTYKIRVYTAGSVAGETATFDICVTTPAPITNDECATAMPTAVNDDMKCEVYSSGAVTAGATASPEPSTCFGSKDDDVWFSFVAKAKTHYLELKNVEGTTKDLGHSVYSGVCGSLEQKYCSPSGSLVSDYSGFEIGQTYYVRVWSNSPVKQDVTFDLCIGTAVPPIITNTSKYTPTQLVEDVLFGTKCASITNVHTKTGTDFGSVNGIGYFDKSLSPFPFKEGVILTTGDALRAPGPNNKILSDGINAWPGDKDLENILAQSDIDLHSLNASVLEFDFVPFADEISFNFLFASDEYGTYQCNFADAFAFVLTQLEPEPGVPVNLAVLPNGDPISVVTIRDKKFNSQCESQNPQYFADFYLQLLDGSGINPIGDPTNYTGLTVPLTAKANVVPNKKYHIKLVIADRQDKSFDSAVFLEGGSFNIGSVSLGNDLTGPNSLCPGTTATLVSGLDPAQFNFSWTKDTGNGPVAMDEHGPNLVVSESGTYAVSAQFGVSSCYTTDSVVVEVYHPESEPGPPKNLNICDTTGAGVFDLTQNAPIILASYATPHTVSYFLSQDDANNSQNAIANPSAFQYNGGGVPQTIFVRISTVDIGCYQTTSFQINVEDLSPRFSLSGPTSYCPLGSTTLAVVPVDNNFDPGLVTYSWMFNGNEVGTSSSLLISGSANYGSYTVTVNRSGCKSVKTFDITNSNTVWDVALAAPAALCPNETGTVSVNVANNILGAPVTYTYTLPDLSTVESANNSLTINAIGTYCVNVSILGCYNAQAACATVVNDTSAFAIEIVSGCNGNQFELTANPVNGSFDAAASGYVWTGPGFTAVDNKPNSVAVNEKGHYTVKVTTPDGCSSEEFMNVENISCAIQKGISPNGDDKNESLVLTDVRKVEIFNRYGAKVFSHSNYTNQWHGQSDDGSALPDGTYYYVVYRNSGETVAGWIYVIR